MVDFQARLRLAVTQWNGRAGRAAKSKHRHRVGTITTGSELPLAIVSQDSEAAVDIALIDVPAYGNCLYHAVWTSTERQGSQSPFGLRATAHVYTLRVMVAERVVSLIGNGVLIEERDPIEVGDLVAMPDEYLEYSGQVPLMAMSMMLKRTIVTLSADGISGVSPHNFEELIGEDERYPPIFIFHCNAEAVQTPVAFARRNHYCAVKCDARALATLQGLVAQFRRRAADFVLDLTEPVQTEVWTPPSTGVTTEMRSKRSWQEVGKDSTVEIDQHAKARRTESTGESKSDQTSAPHDLSFADILTDLSARARSLSSITDEQLNALTASQQYTRCPQLALLFFHCCSNDPRAYVFNNERLLDESSTQAIQRLESVLEGPASSSAIGHAQDSANRRASSSTDLHACASCCEILTAQESSSTLPIVKLPRSFELTPTDLASYRSLPDAVRSVSTQVYGSNGRFYHLNPDLVVDEDGIVLCSRCRDDPRKFKYSIASGHDYGRIASLPRLNEISAICISPLRCFGIEMSVSGKHSKGHSICFPSDGPVQCAKVLPRVEVDESVRVTFLGSRDEWSLKQSRITRLYDVAVDDVYTWLKVLMHTHSSFLDNNIVVEDSPQRRDTLTRACASIDANIAFEDSTSSPQDEDEDYSADDDEESTEVLVTSSAVLKPISDEVGRGSSTRIIDSLLELVQNPQESGLSNATVIPISREEEPVLEWTQNGTMIACAFPHLFLRGGHFLPTGTWPSDLIKHLMRYYDGRFERNTQFVALLFNQLQRHAAVRRAAKVGISNTGSLERFGSLVSSDRFRERLIHAKNNPTSSTTKQLNASLLRILSLVGSTVPFSPFERASSRPKIAALRYRYGVPQHWVTIAPPEHDDLILQRIGMIRKLGNWNQPNNIFSNKTCTFEDFPHDLRTSARSRLNVANKYPALGAQVFQRCMSTVFEDVIDCSPSKNVKLSRHFGERGHGAFGKIAAHCYIVEPQKEGRLHAHALLYTTTYTPELLTRISCSEPLRQRAAEWLDSVSCTFLQSSIHKWRSGVLESDIRLPRAFEIPFPSATKDINAFLHAAEKFMATTNFHSHSPTCHKTARGNYMCRLARPSGIHTSQTCPLLITRDMLGNFSKGIRPILTGRALDSHTSRAIDRGYDYRGGEVFRRPLPGPIVWELHRPESDKFVVETNRVLAALTRSHTNSSIINGEDAGDVVEYQQNYMTKGEPSLQSGIPVLLSAIDHIKAYPSQADDRDTDIRRGKYAAARTVNAFSGAHEWSHSIMLHAISGHTSFTSSDSFWYVFPHLFVTRLKKTKMKPVDVTLCGTRDLDAPNDEEAPEASIDDELNELVAMAINDSHHHDSSSVPTRGGGTRSYKIDDTTIFVSQVDSYLHRGDHFRDYSPIEFECIVDVLPLRTDPESRSGRKRRVGFPFATNHPLYGHYLGFLRAKQHTPIFGGAPPPTWRLKNRQAREATSRYLLASFTSWRGDATEFPFNERGLLELCEAWDHSDAPLISRQRYRYIRNILKRGHRNNKNEQIITDWRNRNVDLWEKLKTNERHSRTKRRQGELHQDMEKNGLLGESVDLYALTQQLATGAARKRDQLRAIRLRFESVMDPESPTDDILSAPAFDRSDVTSHGLLTGLQNNNGALRAIAARLSTLTQPHTIEDASDNNNDFERRTRGQLPHDAQSLALANLSPQQREVFRAVLSGLDATDSMARQTRTMLHGAGGTGKSFVVRTITAEFEKRGFEVVRTCTTGAGACQLTKGYTFHSALKARTQTITPDVMEHLKQLFTSNVKLVVVDEVSMMSPELLVTLDERLRLIYDSNLDFGGISILLVGDFFQLPVVRGTALCAAMYTQNQKPAHAKAQLLFKTFKVAFLTEQQRARQCLQQQELLNSFRKLPVTYPVGSEWTALEKTNYQPISGNVVQHLIQQIEPTDVIGDLLWREKSVILVTGNADRAMLNASMAVLMAKYSGRLVFRWRKMISTTDDYILKIQNLLYNEDERPELFGYFLKDAIAQVLDNSNGNVSMGVANGSRCRYHSLAWEDPEKKNAVVKLIEDALRKNEAIVDVPFPPDFINITLLDRNSEPIHRTSWPRSDNLASDTDGDIVVVPIGIVKSTADKFKVKIPATIHHPQLVIYFDQHAVDLAMALTVWKAQGSTFDRVILHLEGLPGSPPWQFEHFYVALSRVRAAAHLRCLPLSLAYDRAKLMTLRPRVHTIRWMMDISSDGHWNGQPEANNETGDGSQFTEKKQAGGKSRRRKRKEM